MIANHVVQGGGEGKTDWTPLTVITTFAPPVQSKGTASIQMEGHPTQILISCDNYISDYKTIPHAIIYNRLNAFSPISSSDEIDWICTGGTDIFNDLSISDTTITFKVVSDYKYSYTLIY